MIKFIRAAETCAREKGYYDYFVFFVLAYYSGARKGEILALRWNCLEGDTIKIKKSIAENINGMPYLETPPKNKSSVRNIRLPRQALEALARHRERQQARIPGWVPEGFICGYWRPLSNSTLRRESIKYAAMAGLKSIRIHDFRHSHASLLINSGINALEVAHRLGHSSVDQTLKTCSHLFPDESEKTIRLLENI